MHLEGQISSNMPDLSGLETMQSQAAPIHSQGSNPSFFFHGNTQSVENDWISGWDWSSRPAQNGELDGDKWHGNAILKSSPWAKKSESSKLQGLASSPQTRREIDGLSPYLVDGDASHFSSSLPNLFHNNKLRLAEPVNNAEDELEDELSLEELESHTIGNLLPDDEEELLAGIIDDFDCMPSTNMEEYEDFDLFSSGGGMELDGSSQDGLQYSNGQRMDALIGSFQHALAPASVVGEHPYGEHPSRTLFVRNINSNVEDTELRALFETYGDIRTLYTACKHRGFVMISYYDIRAARSAMRALQNKPLRRRKLDIHFSIPKDNPSDKDVNQGTLVVFNLDASVSNDDLRQIFGDYGEVKEIRETPHKRHHKFIEFYDVRAAEAALRALNRSDIAGKRIKLEPSRPGGARRSLMQQLTQELEQEENRPYAHPPHSSWTNSPPGPQWGNFSSPDNGSLGLHTPTFAAKVAKPVNGIAPTINTQISSPSKNGVIGGHIGQPSHVGLPPVGHAGAGMHQVPSHPHSLPEYNSSLMNPLFPFSPSGPALPSSAAFRSEGLEGSHFPRTSTGLGDGTNYGNAIGARVTGGGSTLHASSNPKGSLSSQQFLWGNHNHYSQSIQSSSPAMWPPSPAGQPFNHNGHPHSFSGTHNHLFSTVLSTHGSHVGSAPSEHSIMERGHVYFPDSPDISSMVRPSLAITHPMNINGGNGLINFTAAMRNGNPDQGPVSPSLAMLSPHQRTRMFSAAGASLSYIDGFNDRGRGRRGDNSSNQAENKKQYQLDIDRILSGEDIRTTLMIKNIPNKYTSKMLLAAIDEHHRGTYDFIYLPIDFKNKCNVGYAFINMISPSSIVPFYQAFHGKKWEKFNSEKVAFLAYARIQGKAALVAHFQNSSLMNEDKRCRPILFHSDGPNMGDQEPFPVSVNVRMRPGRERGSSSSSNGSQHGSPTGASDIANGAGVVGSPVSVENPSLDRERE